MELNYTAITSSPLYAKSKKQFETTGKQKSKYIWLFFIGVLLLFLIMFVLPLSTPVIIIVVFTLFFINLFKLIPEGARAWKVLQQALDEFAQQNSFFYQKAPYMQVAGNNLPEVQLSLPLKAKLETNSGHMKGTFHQLPFDYISGSLELIDYKGFSAQSGSRETRSLTALYITLPISLPKLFIDTKRNNVSGFEAKANNIEELHGYNLEGDFPKHYQVFAQKDDQINVLSILTPEVMQKLLEHKYYDVWIEGNKLVVFVFASPFEYFAGVPVIFPTAEMLLLEIDKIARTLRERP